MAIKATIYKAKLEISNCDRNYFHSHELTISCHPSETEQRMMVRLLAFILFASERLSFTKGLCADDEPELWDKNLSGEIELWISLGQIDEKQLRKSLGRSKQVIIFTHAGQKSSIWWKKNQPQYSQLNNLQIINVKSEDVEAIQSFVSRNMDLQATIQEGIIWLSDTSQTISIEPEVWLRS
ncbi:MAG: YaeQ family protein [gamma proteobacterium symbiont of Taylorina sp.]|nr:YaeQ family protein [gamma proteobacterium symbiont of Taylorina sp.]